jgi:hypothetical protein
MQSPKPILKRGSREDWTLERIGSLSVAEIKALRDNAQRLNEPSVVELCLEALKGARSTTARGRGKAGPRTKARRLIARINAFQARGVLLDDARTSWGGVRKSDGVVVVALWADAIESGEGACRYLLWAPNVEGSRPWSDKPAGQERLEQCKRALQLGRAEGLLVYGQRLATHLPEDKAYAIHGVDADTVLTFEIEQRGDEFWATWGKKAAAAASTEPS